MKGFETTPLLLPLGYRAFPMALLGLLHVGLTLSLDGVRNFRPVAGSGSERIIRSASLDGIGVSDAEKLLGMVLPHIRSAALRLGIVEVAVGVVPFFLAVTTGFLLVVERKGARGVAPAAWRPSCWSCCRCWGAAGEITFV